MTVQGVIFDLGGTLAALTTPLEAGALDRANAAGLLEWLRRRGFAVEEGFVDALVVERQACFARRAEGVVEVTAAEALRPVFQRYGLPHDAASLAAAEAAFFEPELATMRALPGATALLRWVRERGLHAGVLSNASSHYFVVECCRRLGFAPFLDPIVSSAQVGWMKPDPRAFAPILSAWSLSPPQVVMVGDTPSADIAGANRLRMRSILIAPNASSDPSGEAASRPHAVAVGLTEVRQVLEQWTVSSRQRG